MKIVNIRLRTGEELLGEFTHEKNDNGVVFYKIENPVSVKFEDNTISGRDWLFFSEKKDVWLCIADIMYMSDASKEGIDYRRHVLEMMKKEQEMENEFLTQQEKKEFKRMLDALIEAKDSIKH